ncbi:MAG TPA: ATP-binding protein [Candidatus Margulisiibacteriota bacterium]|nr:ATP-binding protein [Candidatus Margulisiibacteriota bacterium]
MEPVCDSSLEEHLSRIETYMRSCGLLAYPHTRGALRRELAEFLTARSTEAIDAWVALIGPALGIPPAEWSDLRQSMREALVRWIQHIEDPENIDTYVYLRCHARRAFISRFPPSRFLAGQMQLRQIISDYIRSAYQNDRDKRDALLALWQQEFQERVLHISDFFVEAREQELREQEASYRKSVDNAPVAIFKLCPEYGTILDANLVSEKVVGYSRNEMVGMRIWDLIPLAERPRLTRLFEETRTRGNSSSEDLHLQARDGELVPVFFNAGLIEYGHHRSFQVICVDISARKRLESQLIQSEKMAAIGQLAAGIAHELRNPLGIIMNALYDLSEIVGANEAAVQEDVRIAKEEISRAQAIINNLLEFSRESRAELERVDINDLVRKTLQLMNKSLQNSGVRVVTELTPLGRCVANQNALRQIFLNLITNAQQAMPHGGELRVRTAPLLDGRIQLEFCDTGVGIPPEHLNDIFNPFFTTKAPGQGTGLGLSVVHSVVKRYHGDIHVESEVNRGTTFTIEFPCPCVDTTDAVLSEPA